MRLGTDLPSSLRDSLGEKPGLGSCTQESEGETPRHAVPMRQSSFPYLLVLPQFMLRYHVPFSPSPLFHPE